MLAIITAGVGLYSHYSSDWSGVDRDYFKGLTGDNAPYHICDDWYPKDGCTVIPLDLCDLFALIPGFPSVGCKIEFDTCNRCPKIALERFFVGASIICAIGALASLGLSFASKSKGLKFAVRINKLYPKKSCTYKEKSSFNMRYLIDPSRISDLT